MHTVSHSRMYWEVNPFLEKHLARWTLAEFAYQIVAHRLMMFGAALMNPGSQSKVCLTRWWQAQDCWDGPARQGEQARQSYKLLEHCQTLASVFSLSPQGKAAPRILVPLCGKSIDMPCTYNKFHSCCVSAAGLGSVKNCVRVTVFDSCIRAWWGRQGSNWLSCGINCELEALPLWTWLWRCGSRGCDPLYRPCFHTKMWIQASIERLGWSTYFELWARQWKSVVGRPIFLHIPPFSANRLTRSDVAGCAARDSRVQGGAPDQSIILRGSMNPAQFES